MVREAAALLLGRRAFLQTLWCERSRGALAERDFCPACNARAGVAGIASLRRRNRALAAAASPHNRRHDRLLARRRHRHAFQRHAHHCDGLRRRRPRPHPQRKLSHTPTHAVARPNPLRLFPGLSRSRERAPPESFFAAARFSSGHSSQNAGATPSAYFIRQPSPLSASPHSPGTSSAPAAIPISSASSSSNTISNASSPPNSSTSSLFWFYIPVVLVAFCLGPCRLCARS